MGIFFAESVGNMASNEVPDGGGDAKWAEF